MKTTIDLHQARPEQAPVIASLIMEAMDLDCCQHFAGPQHTLEDFHQLMTQLVARDDSQYSYRNTTVAVAADGTVAGILVSYDGAQLHSLREAFIRGAKAAFGIDYSGMDDETQAGELYLDSLCVSRSQRGQGIATALLNAGCDKARQLGLSRVGLLVDKGNPKAERLYLKLGFQYVNDTAWGGHPMRHLQKQV